MGWCRLSVCLSFELIIDIIKISTLYQGLFQTPSNSSHFLWQSAAAEFLPCDEIRNKAFAKKSVKKTKLDPIKDKARIKGEMSLITGRLDIRTCTSF